MYMEYLKIAFRSLKRRKLRSWLTMLGIIIGIAAVISLVSLGQGMRNSIDEQFEDIGSDKIFIQPKNSFGLSMGGALTNELTVSDAEFLESTSGIRGVTYYTMTSGKIEFQGTTKYYLVVAVPSDVERLKLLDSFMGIDYIKGRPLNSGDSQSTTLGYYFNTRGLFDGRNINVQDRITINDKKFSVVGIHGPIGSSEDDKMILIPEPVFREIFDIEERVDMIVIQVVDEKNINEVGEEVTRALARHRGLKTGKEDFTVSTPEDLLESFSTILDVVQAVFIGIALVSLFVGSVGITNTMYTSVLERHKEIGIMKAIGARNSDIFILFLFESGLLGLVGGTIGVIVGIILAKSVEIISTAALGKTFLIAYMSWPLIIGALLFAFILGALVGSLPARSASKLPAVDTLRDE